jgi:O-6-methylguanine DNA methyltransferase
MKGTHAMNILSDTVIETGLSDLPALQPPSDLLPNVLYRTGLSDLCWQAESPIGPLLIAASREGITAVDLAESRDAFLSRYRERFGRDVRHIEHPTEKLARSIERLLNGDRRTPPPFDLSHSTPFEAAVLRKALEIPRGQVRPYSWIAQEIGSPRASRAVGTALAGNPVPVLIPCHRVVRGDGVIGNYIFGTDVKRSLLTEERANIDRLEVLGKQGIRFVGSDTTHIFCFPTCRYNVSDAHLQTFHSETEARSRGYRPCKVCRPALAG